MGVNIIILLVFGFIYFFTIYLMKKGTKNNEKFFKQLLERQKEKLVDQEWYIRYVKQSFDNLIEYRKSEDNNNFKHDIIHDVKLSDRGNISFIMQDNCNQKDITLHIIGGDMTIRGGCYQNRPNLYAIYRPGEIEIVDIPPNDYQHMGYGTMLIDTLDIIAKSLKAKNIYGVLVGKNEKRDDFYRNNGYNVYYNNQFGYIEKIFQY